MKCSPVVPALIPTSKEEVIEMSKTLSFSHEFHLDLVDGEFVAAKSWPFGTADEPLSVKSHLDAFTLEVDLMVKNPTSIADEWIRAGADMLVFHVESVDFESFKNFVNSTNISIGVSLHGNTSLDTFFQYAELADYVQLMGIETIGAQGQAFDEAVLDKIQAVKERFPRMSITVDGSVNPNTIKRLKDAGADRFIVGSAIVKQPDPRESHKKLESLICP